MTATTQFSRTADANWKGGIGDGHGLTSTETGVLREAMYNFSGRFEGGKEGTNPEELIAAAAASCFCMALSKTLSDDGYTPEKLRARATVEVEMTGDGPAFSELSIRAEGMVPGVDPNAFVGYVEKTEAACPVVQLLKPGFRSVKVSAEAVQ